MSGVPEGLKDTEFATSHGKVKLPEILSYDEIDRFLLAIEDLEDLIAARLMLFGGLRVDEAASLEVKHVCPERVAVFIEEGKSGDGWSPVDIATVTMALCRASDRHLEPGDQLYPWSKRTLQDRVSKAYAKAEIPWGPTCHTLRHTCATWQLDQGIPLETVKNNLRHADISTTQIYLHLNIRQRSRTYRDASRFGT